MSKNITNLVNQAHLDPIKGSRQVTFPSHIYYTYEILVFCKGTNSNIQAIILLSNYASIYGQNCNSLKSVIFVGGMSPSRTYHLENNTCFNRGSLPFTYLGIPIFKGWAKVFHLYFVVTS